ncbi:uncharacterized membrane protein YsdA (DUF1294 family) [Cytobacillus eiseniae]|uniref:Uncharacterized membrane protein YsdA (DUF1294 family) n=1 Tax=Cytobacillus eiseniae TaxID=762947 RepID=A0ABS4RCR4_9BACI|nr:DUF1294 domain-containing protein [Cytobacillus eiseniae]MBP2240684.1 uncharacterized membrane protein YsdA (DUF1294 family) [Cytobacillus eiseniae]
MVKIVVLLFIIMNIVGYFIMKVDKEKAKKNEYRISEKNLWLIAFFFGALGMMIGMQTFRHKTKHLQFKIGLPVLALIEVIVGQYILNLLS